jgi:hypothetical protein
VPAVWGTLGFVMFNLPEGALSQTFWRAVYLTCPSWRIEGRAAIFLVPFLNGLMYFVIATVGVLGFNFVRNSRGRPN